MTEDVGPDMLGEEGEPWEMWYWREVVERVFNGDKDKATEFYRRMLENDLKTVWAWPEVYKHSPIFIGMN